jgi:hypothetical protein
MKFKQEITDMFKTPRQRDDFCAWCNGPLLEDDICDCEVETVRRGTLFALLPIIEKALTEVEKEENERCKDIILKHTGIPKGAKNPTRDATVILGEELVELITLTDKI